MPRLDMPGGDDAAKLSAAVLKANQWLREELLQERASMNNFMESRHALLMRQYEALLQPLLVEPDPEQPTAASEAADSGKVGMGPDAIEVEAHAAGASEDSGEKPAALEAAPATPSASPRSDAGGKAAPASPPARLRNSVSSLTSSLTEEDKAEGRFHDLRRFVSSTTFECTFGVLIFANSVVMAFNRQYISFDSNYMLGNRGAMPAEDVWPHADSIFEILEWVFGLIFTVEVVLKLVTLQKKFFKSTLWNVFDLIIVIFWLADRVALHYPFDPMILRLVRLARLVRLLRAVRSIRIMDPLFLMIQSIKASVSLLCWALLLMFLLMMIVAMFANSVLEPFIRNERHSLESRQEVYMWFGSFSRAFTSMFEITVGNWGPPTRLLMNHVSEWWVVAILLYKVTLGFCVLQVITSVFIQQVFKVASRDESVMIREKEHASNAYKKNLMSFFRVLDTSGDGMISKNEFQEALANPTVKHWFAALEVEVHSVDQVFELLDDGDGMVSADEFLLGVTEMKSNARHQDIMVISREIRKNRRKMEALQEKVDFIGFQMSARRGGIEESVKV